MRKQDLDKQREQIDKIDTKIVRSLNQRLAIAHEIGKIKKAWAEEWSAEATLIRSAISQNTFASDKKLRELAEQKQRIKHINEYQTQHTYQTYISTTKHYPNNIKTTSQHKLRIKQKQLMIE